MGISEELNHNLDYMTNAITVGGVTIPQGVYTTWIIMAVLVVLSIWFTRHMALVPT